MTKRNMLRRWRGWTLAFLLLGGVAAMTSCGGSSRAGTDSHTHWLAHCEGDGDCGNLSCVCGVCSKVCEAGAECEALGSEASCRVPLACAEDSEQLTLCQKGCQSDEVCQALAADQVCYQGYCEKASAVPVEPDPCAAMDAEDSGDDCVDVQGYAFDGLVCRPIVCSCVGEDCDTLYDSQKACDDATAGCLSELGVSRACQVNTDCQVASRSCCPAPTDLDSVLAVNAGSTSSLSDLLCEGIDGCPAIFIPPKPSIYAQCMDGQCEAIDVAEIAGCASDDDCLITASDCCACGVQPGAGWLAVASPDQYAGFAGCDAACDLCLDPVPSEVLAVCDTDFGLCSLTTQ